MLKLLWSWIQITYTILFHKYCIFVAGISINKKIKPTGLQVSMKRMILHDLSKFTPSEFFAYASHYYGKTKGRPADHDFDIAWIHHYQNNDHHHEFFQKDGVILQMKKEALMELVADWFAASRAYDHEWPIPGQWKWLQHTYPKVNMHINDKIILGAILSILGFEKDIPSFNWDTSFLLLNNDSTGTQKHFESLHKLYSSKKRE